MRFRRVITLLLIGILFSLLACTVPTPSDTTNQDLGILSVHFIDVGQGDSILINLGTTEILLDGGGRNSEVASYISAYVDEPLEVMVATHPHADHIGGLIEVLNIFQVEQIWHNGDISETKTYSDFMNRVNSEGADIHTARLHDVIKAGELELFVHHPTDLEGSTNNNSIVLHFEYGEIDFLFTGDAEKIAEGQMMMLSSVRIPEVEILKVGHHGSRTASSLDFLGITSPEAAIYMADEGNRYGHPHQETLDALNDIGAEIYGTDIYGTIVITTDGNVYDPQFKPPP
ncbi:ComEC/Rec2 family competence protein [Chloroflexota bacterium]